MDDHTVTGRVLAVLDAVADLGDAASLAAVTRACGIPKPTVRRIAADLVARGLLERSPDGYRLGLRLLDLGGRAASQNGLREAATPHIQDLFARSGEIVWISAVTDTAHVLLHAAYGANRAADMRGPWPTRLPSPRFLTTAAGRIVLGHRPELIENLHRRPLPRVTPYTVTQLPRIHAAVAAARDTNLATESEQSMLGYECLAAGIQDAAGRMIGVLGVTGRTGMMSAARLTRPLLAAASGIQAEVKDLRPVQGPAAPSEKSG